MNDIPVTALDIGSEFHWMGFPQEPFLPWPDPCIWFRSGRCAFLSIWNKRTTDSQQKQLWVPDFFCHDVTSYWEKSGVNIRLYKDDPRWPYPDWKTLTPQSEDIVLAVNYFGVREGVMWQEWQQKHPEVMLVEDHSHDPFSPWAQSSTATYAFASIRKIFPTPDGAILWSPQHYQLPPEPCDQNMEGSALKLAAMIWKKEYLDSSNREPSLKDAYRAFQIKGEKELSNSNNPGIATWSRSLLAYGFPKQWRTQRKTNANSLLKLLADHSKFEPLFQNWHNGFCPFNVVLVFNSTLHRETFLRYLITRGIYPAIHWTIHKGSKRVINLSSRILTIPVDQRYNLDDMERIASVFREIEI